MSFGDVIGLMVAVGGMVGMVGLLSQVYRRRLEHKERIAELRATGGSAAAVQDREATIERLEHRIRVLERIATDKTSTLAAQIEDLRQPAN